MTRILHTSDWHLGASLEGLSRDEEHAKFLGWLADTLTEQHIDVLVVAGDVFDQAQPSSESQRLYYRFLHKVARRPLRKIVVVGGNHDSASRLDAPRDILLSFDVHVVGGLGADRDTWNRCLCPIDDGDGVACVIAAVPFMHEFRLGVRTALQDESVIRASFTEAFRGFYQELANRAEAIAKGAPLIATGHLAAEGAERGDAPAEVHLIGTIGALSSSIFDPRFSYVALGHVHRSFHVGESRAWYCGTPVALGLAESKVPRRVFVYDTDAPEAPVPVIVPSFRELKRIRGPLDRVIDEIRGVTWETPLPPFLYTEVEVEQYTAGIEGQIVQAAEDHLRKGMRLLHPKQVKVGATNGAVDEARHQRLKDLAPEEVFKRLCALRGEVADDTLLNAFRSLLSSPEDEVTR